MNLEDFLKGFIHKLALTGLLGAVTPYAASSLLANEPARTDGSDIGVSIMGAIVQKSTENNVALIKETSTGSVKAVKAGHIILDRYKVLEIHGKYMVIITKDSKRYLVYQDKFASEFAKGSTAPADTNATRPTVAFGDSFREDGFERVKGQVTMSAGYRDKLVKQDLAKVLMQATAEPFMENGQIVGFKFTQIDGDSIYAKGGLVDDDVITVINGTKLNNVAGAIGLLKSMKDAESVEVELLRGGTPIKIVINVN